MPLDHIPPLGTRVRIISPTHPRSGLVGEVCAYHGRLKDCVWIHCSGLARNDVVALEELELVTEGKE